MGLIGSLLGTLYCGGSGYYLSPLDFVRSPTTWIISVGRYRATHLQAPNFGFPLTVRKWKALKTKVCYTVLLGPYLHTRGRGGCIHNMTIDVASRQSQGPGFRRTREMFYWLFLPETNNLSCVDRLDRMDGQPEMDLSSLVHVITGAEPIDAASIDTFKVSCLKAKTIDLVHCYSSTLKLLI